ncbi:MAG: DUF1553 domain-containing protein, partial [Planctomycetaceae bacterium]|nr:DUF1553 domain-containing protein [Planctomycetaceae bacterium]
TGDPRGGTRILGGLAKPLSHPRTGQPVAPAGPGGPVAVLPPDGDSRRVLADWITDPDNPYFSTTLVNRLWAHYFGRGLVEPVDDLRATNPASNEPLLNALAAEFVRLGFDVKAITQLMLESHVYQLSAQPNASNELDAQNYSHAAWKPLSAEVLLDAISQVTGVPEEFNGWPRGYRAIQIWDNKLPSHFMKVFGRPARQTVCACERGTEPGIAQVLHLMNAPEIDNKIHHLHGRAAAMAVSSMSDQSVVEELYLTCLSRYPQPEEMALMKSVLADSSDRRGTIEDLLWTLMNKREFVFNH